MTMEQEFDSAFRLRLLDYKNGTPDRDEERVQAQYYSC